MYLNHICRQGTAMFPTAWSIYLKIAVTNNIMYQSDFSKSKSITNNKTFLNHRTQENFSY